MYSFDFKRIAYFQFILVTLLLYSCGASKQFEIATTLGTVDAYEKFLNEYSKSSYARAAAIRLKALYEIEAWNKAKYQNTSSAYQTYIQDFPTGKNITEAKRLFTKLEKEEKINSDWYKAVSANTISGYNYFLSKNPYSKFSSSAKAAINKIIEVDWDLVKNSGKVEKLQEFIKKHPSTSYASQARSKISEIKEQNDWNQATYGNSTNSYNQYLRTHPNGKHSYLAKSRIKEIEEERYILPAWNRALSQNTYQGYRSFYQQYPNSSYGSKAKAKVDMFENAGWSKASSSNSISSYKTFLANYPYSDMAETARKRIIDLEVAEIFKGDYGYLPPMNKTSSFGYGQSRPTTNTIEITNDTAYELTVWYSGATSKKIILNPRRSTSFTLPNGAYKVAAEVKASNVTKYAGNENLTGGSYDSKFYIETRFGF